jgi:AbrB family looped-hinge helix DNA binding protein
LAAVFESLAAVLKVLLWVGPNRVSAIAVDPSHIQERSFLTKQLTSPRRWYYFCIKVMENSMESAITKKGQATIPKAVREHLHLKPGDRVKFFLHPDGSVVLLPKLPVAALRGMLKHRGAPATIEEMDEVVITGANEGVSRSRRR